MTEDYQFVNTQKNFAFNLSKLRFDVLYNKVRDHEIDKHASSSFERSNLNNLLDPYFSVLSMYQQKNARYIER